MHIRIKTYATFCFCLMLNGCANTMYFYETEKISLTVEARPDSSQPVQGSLGFKQRVALIVPKKNNKLSADESNNQPADGEALSAMSSFNFKITDNPTGFDPIYIQTAFITGAAANKFSDDSKKAEAVADAISSYRAQALSEIEIEKQRLDRILVYVTDGSNAINSTRMNNLIARAEKVDPNTMTATVIGEIIKTTTRSELEKLLLDPLDAAIYPIYKAILTN